MSKKLKKQIEILDAVGQEDEKKGIKAVQELHKNDEIEQEKKFDDTLNKLDFNRNKGDDYYSRRILEEAQLQLKDQSIPRGYYFFFSLTSKGLVLWIRDTKKRWHANGMSISKNPLFDAQAIMRLIDKGLLYADILSEKENPKTDIILP